MPARARGTRAASFGPLETAPVHRVAEAMPHPEPSRAHPPRSPPHPPPRPRLLRPLRARARASRRGQDPFPPYPSPCSFPAPRVVTVPSSFWNP